MKEKALELSPNFNLEFKNLSHFLGLDKPTQMRICYLLDEFLKKSPVVIKKNEQSIYLRVATFIACKSMIYKNKKGDVVRGLRIYTNTLVKDADFGMNEFIKGLN